MMPLSEYHVIPRAKLGDTFQDLTHAVRRAKLNVESGLGEQVVIEVIVRVDAIVDDSLRDEYDSYDNLRDTCRV